MTFSCKKFSCWEQSYTLSAAVLYTFNMTNVSCCWDINRSSFTCLPENDSSVWMWIVISGFYRILRPRETPLVRHSEPLVLKRINDVSFIFVYSLSRCLSGGSFLLQGHCEKVRHTKISKTDFLRRIFSFPGFTLQGQKSLCEFFFVFRRSTGSWLLTSFS